LFIEWSAYETTTNAAGRSTVNLPKFQLRMTTFSTIAASLMLWMLAVSAADGAAAADIADAARTQVGKTVRYDPSYVGLDYPNGDVPIEMGVCTDVVVRALRASLGMDLQKLVHEDMRRNFPRYPQIWGLKEPDKNIDHRRVPNLQTFFKRNGWELPISKDIRDYQPGDLVTCIVPPNLPHIMIVSGRSSAAGRPFVIHNIGAGTQEEDRLFEFKLTGHYRVKTIEPTASATGVRPMHPETHNALLAVSANLPAACHRPYWPCRSGIRTEPTSPPDSAAGSLIATQGRLGDPSGPGGRSRRSGNNCNGQETFEVRVASATRRILAGQSGESAASKAAGDSRSPGGSAIQDAPCWSARSWSAALLCRFSALPRSWGDPGGLRSQIHPIAAFAPPTFGPSRKPNSGGGLLPRRRRSFPIPLCALDP
jgi:uncharacterized protein YijF (DUF1287 family)